MESFKFNAVLKGNETEVLVVPDDSYERSLFHIIAFGQEFNQIEYSDDLQWQIIAGEAMQAAEFYKLTKKIEAHY